MPTPDRKPDWLTYGITTEAVERYLYSMLPKRDPVLAEMEDYATQHEVPIVGPAVARVLQQLALIIQAKTIFELGSAIGYSTIWCAQAVGEQGQVIYTDGDRKAEPPPRCRRVDLAQLAIAQIEGNARRRVHGADLSRRARIVNPQPAHGSNEQSSGLRNVPVF